MKQPVNPRCRCKDSRLGAEHTGLGKRPPPPFGTCSLGTQRCTDHTKCSASKRTFCKRTGPFPRFEFPFKSRVDQTMRQVIATECHSLCNGIVDNLAAQLLLHNPARKIHCLFTGNFTSNIIGNDPAGQLLCNLFHEAALDRCGRSAGRCSQHGENRCINKQRAYPSHYIIYEGRVETSHSLTTQGHLFIGIFPHTPLQR